MINHNFDKQAVELREGEYIASIMRKHWIMLLRMITPYIILFVLPVIVSFFIPTQNISSETTMMINFFTALWMLAILMAIFTIWTDYYLDIWIVTNQRILDIEQITLFKREEKTLRMETVQDLRVDKNGPAQEFLDYGTLRVETAGRGDTDAKIVGIPKPTFERDIIMEQVRLINISSKQNSGNKIEHPHIT